MAGPQTVFEEGLDAHPEMAMIAHGFSELALGHRRGLGTRNETEDEAAEDEDFEIKLVDLEGREPDVTFPIFPFHDIELVKRMLLRRLGREKSFRISDIEIFYNGMEMPNRRLMISFGNLAVESGGPVELKWRFTERINKGDLLKGIRSRGGVKINARLSALVEEINQAFQKRQNPRLTMEGTGGTYILSDCYGRSVAVFKPVDEEAFAPFNPRGYVGRFGQPGFRAGVVSGEGAMREVAAYMLDAYYESFSGVPSTSIVEMIHPHLCYDASNPTKTRDEDCPLFVDGLLRRKKKAHVNPGVALRWKIGSLQEFVPAKDSSSDFDTRMFAIGDVHRIGILDIRLANMDRNDGNILVVRTSDLDAHNVPERVLNTPFMKRRPEYSEKALLTPDGHPAKVRLLPIDHGLTLPDCLDITDFDFTWLNWPQAHIPFLPEELAYIEKLNPDSDAGWLSTKLEVRPACLRLMQTTTRLLQRGAKYGMTLHQIASLMVRTSPDEASPLEKVIKVAQSQTCFATFATALVHRRDMRMKYAMDLALVTKDPAEPQRGVKWAKHHGEASQNTSSAAHNKMPNESFQDANEEQVPRRPRSKTLGRLNASSVAQRQAKVAGVEAAKLRNFTAYRTRDLNAADAHSQLWMHQDSAGRPVTPDWSDKKFSRLFFESFETVLDFLIREKMKSGWKP